MSTSKEYMQFVLDQLEEFPDVTYRKMFGEYMVYLQGRPVLLVCDNCAMVKKLPELAELMRGAPDGLPYEGARVHSVLDLEDRELVRQVMDILCVSRRCRSGEFSRVNRTRSPCSGYSGNPLQGDHDYFALRR